MNMGLNGSQSQSGHGGIERNFLSPAGIEPSVRRYIKTLFVLTLFVVSSDLGNILF